MSAVSDEEYLTVAEAATLFKVSQSTVWRWINRGTISAYRVGHRGVRLKRSELSRLATPAREEQRKEERRTNVGMDKLSPLTEAEQQAGLAALGKLRLLREELLRRRKGVQFPNAAEELDRSREQRTEKQE